MENTSKLSFSFNKCPGQSIKKLLYISTRFIPLLPPNYFFKMWAKSYFLITWLYVIFCRKWYRMANVVFNSLETYYYLFFWYKNNNTLFQYDVFAMQNLGKILRKILFFLSFIWFKAEMMLLLPLRLVERGHMH